jgi:hypothetical protein
MPPVVPCPPVVGLAGIMNTLPLPTFFIAASSRPVATGFRSSSAEFTTSTCALIFSRSGSGL